VVRRVLALIPLGVILLVCAAFAASETLRNRTGSTATAVTVTFSEEVRITSYDESVFPTKEPSSRSETFRFSGGQLENGARFTVSWIPSGAEITGTEWETTGANAAGSSAGASAPLTYEQIMAQIAHYPGPDEPLYVPAEGEQIWLTDLEGHADIYDNDSIKINYSQGFDKSQITKIEVYRNGIKMRFLPEKRDVLTNEQMKTFDGDPLERTPKSYHTDHAIFGYQYGFWLYAGSSGTPHRTLTADIKSPIHLGFDEVWMELNLDWSSTLVLWKLTDADLDAFFGRLKRDGFTGISLELPTFVDTPTANTAWTLDHLDSAISPYTYMRTPTKAEFDRVLGAIGRAGLAAQVRNTAFISVAYPPARDRKIWSSYIVPSNVTAYLESYLAIWQDYMPLFEQHRVALVTPFTEMDGIIGQTEEIKWFYDQLTVGYSGRLGCETSTALYLNGWSPAQNGRTFAQMAPSFWDWRDPQGRPLVNELDVWEVPLSSDKDQRYSQMVIPFLKFVRPALDFYHGKYPENPLMYGELGIQDVDGACTGLWFEVKPRIFDEQETADVWAAMLIGVELQGIRSVSVFCMALGDRAKNEEPTWLFINFDSNQYRVITSLLGKGGTP